MKTEIRAQDWEHRLHVLWGWRHRPPLTSGDPAQGSVARAVLDGCSITARALCETDPIRIRGNFTTFNESKAGARSRIDALLAHLNEGEEKVRKLSCEDQRCLMEVLYHGNRCVAPPSDGHGLDHNVEEPEMKTAINVVLKYLSLAAVKWMALQTAKKNQPQFFEAIP